VLNLRAEILGIDMKSKQLAVIGVFCLFGSASCGSAFAAPSTFQASDVRKLVNLSDARISPDGTRIAVVVSTPNWTTDKADQEIDLVDVASGARRPLTWKRSGISEPRWSPDGTFLAFLAEAPAAKKKADADDSDAGGDDKQTQIFVMRMDGGDPVQVTETDRGVDSFRWSPDGKRFAFVTHDTPANEKAIKAHNKVFQVTDNNFQVRTALTPSNLWVVASTGGKATRLTQGNFSLDTDQQDGTPEPAWSPDGKTIAFTRFPDPYWALSFQSVIDSVKAGGGTPDTLVSATGAADFEYAPAGTAAAFMRPRDGDENNGNAIYVMANGKTFDVTAPLARNIEAYAWMPDGKTLLMTGADGTHSALWEQPLDRAATRLDLGGVEIRPDLSVSKTGTVAFIGSTGQHPGELYVMDIAGGKPRRLTDIDAFTDKLALGRVASINWQGPNGFQEDGVLTYPPDFVQGRKYPLVLEIHGGPESASTETFSPLTQMLAAAGFIVFKPNYRGSTNLGDAYQHAIFRDTGDGPGKDVMAGVAAVEKLGSIDTARIGISGWSYGGYMTTWLTGHYPIWKAAVSGAALTDWVMDYTVAYYQQGDTYYFGGSPWTAKYRDIWREQSPIAYAQNVKAPTLIMGDVGDPNVPLVNSYEWYHALRDNGDKVEFYAYPADTHFPTDIVQTTDVYTRWVDWMTKNLK
jgi:dipeptidyl aminopeptidase/acylaminoacyl peptidase